MSKEYVKTYDLLKIHVVKSLFYDDILNITKFGREIIHYFFF